MNNMVRQPCQSRSPAPFEGEGLGERVFFGHQPARLTNPGTSTQNGRL